MAWPVWNTRSVPSVSDDAGSAMAVEAAWRVKVRPSTPIRSPAVSGPTEARVALTVAPSRAATTKPEVAGDAAPVAGSNDRVSHSATRKPGARTADSPYDA